MPPASSDPDMFNAETQSHNPDRAIRPCDRPAGCRRPPIRTCTMRRRRCLRRGASRGRRLWTRS
eukprot:353472-Chlamydomonas_euryale.AAC.3